MIATFAKPDDLRALAALGANHARWQLTWDGFPHGPADKATVDEYLTWLDGAARHVDSLLPLCRELGLHVLIDLHTPPGGRTPDKDMRLFQDRKFQAAFLTSWERLVARFEKSDIVWGYDLLNEPTEGYVAEGLKDWRELAIEAVQVIRAGDPRRAIIVEAAPWGGPAALADFEPLPFENVVYSFHMYEPQQFTHQNVYNTVAPISYPGMIAGRQWDKEQLRRTLQPVIDWQRDYNVHIYVGEFSAIRWAPGDSAANYLRDCIELFEENKWDWAYHAFREWPGWSVEHIGNRENTALAKEPTSRQQVLTGWFARNEQREFKL